MRVSANNTHLLTHGTLVFKQVLMKSLCAFSVNEFYKLEPRDTWYSNLY